MNWEPNGAATDMQLFSEKSHSNVTWHGTAHTGCCESACATATLDLNTTVMCGEAESCQS